MVFCQFLKQIERSDSLILVILGNLVHFWHLFIPLYQSVITGGRRKDKYAHFSNDFSSGVERLLL